MALRLVWSQRAVRDVEAIAEFIARDSPAYARVVVRNIVNRAKILGQFPRTGRKVPEFDDEEVRELVVYNYRLIYQVTGTQVTVASVIHGKRRLE